MGNAINCNCNKGDDNDEMNIDDSKNSDISSEMDKEDSIIEYTEQITLSKISVGIFYILSFD